MAADDSNTGASRKQVFISYSRTPSENVEFVRDLAGRLIVAGFSVWLDEEQIPAGADIKRMITKAAQQSEVGLFVVTERWVDRPWTQHEVNLFGERPDARLLVVRREETDTGDLGPHLAALRRVDWPEGDGDPDARFWEIYCGITDTAPGRHSEWAEKGRRVVFARTEAPTAEARTQSRPSAKSSVPRISLPRVTAPPRSKADIVLPCAGKPVSHFAGERWTFLVTDLEEWIGVAADGELFPPMGRLVEHSAALVGASNELLVGTYDPMIVRLRGTHWEYQPQESAVLCFTSSPEGFVGGTASGAIVMFGEHDGGPICRMRDPVMGLAYCDHAIMALGAQGMFGRIAWPPRDQETLRWIETPDLGRPVGFFEAIESNCIGVFSATRIAVLDPITEQQIICPRTFQEGIREVIFLGAQSWPFAVLLDNGQLVLVDASLYRTRADRLPHGAVARGCIRAGVRGVAVIWTEDRRLHKVYPDAPAQCIVEDNVLLAYSPAQTDLVHIVRSQREDAVSVQIVSL